MRISIPYPVIDMKKTGENIKRLREAHNISVTDVQQFLGLADPQAVYQWQRGICLPTVDHLCALSHLFGITMNDILILKTPADNNLSTATCMPKQVPVIAKKADDAYSGVKQHRRWSNHAPPPVLLQLLFSSV